jgi:hypothetical protein
MLPLAPVCAEETEEIVSTLTLLGVDEKKAAKFAEAGPLRKRMGSTR